MIPDCSLNEYGKKLDEGEEFQAGAMWGIEYGWLATRHPKLEILVTGSGRGAGDIGVTSHLVVNKELTTRGGAGSLLSHYSSQNPFRLARHRQESLVTQIHKNELIRGYGKGVFQDSETTSERILDALAAVRNGQYDGVLVDEYRLFGLEQQYDLRKRFSIIGDWGASKDRISLPLFVVVGVRENINRGKSGQWEKIQAAIVAKVKRDDEVTRRMLGEWQANTLVLPTEKFIANCHLAAKKYQMSELGQ
ncbi:MAG: hypothetical protein KDB00_30040 [Planctomycetales bacterium]|nr:hypothetical protein [Planctomycetales bacterium]